MKPFTPQLSKIEKRKVLTVITLGDPNKIVEPYMKALYGTAYSTKMKFFKPKGIKMEVGPLSAFWPDAHLKEKKDWTGIWNLEIPMYVKESDLLQKDKDINVKIKMLSGGKIAQILHLGSYSEEGPTVKKLHDFIKENSLEIIGDHEEVYLSRPGTKQQKTLIRYLVK